MYAVIKTGGKQYKVAEGEKLNVELLSGGGEQLSFTPVLVVDGDAVLARPDQLTGATVAARIVGEAKGPKIRGFTYKAKSNNRRRWGHRQKYSTIEITSISKG
jgi:large subunit ribosomal protein L21